MDRDVVIVGAGLAGLCCARRLQEQGVDWELVEAADAVGGRVRTDLMDGFRLDRGFQVLLTAYPEARAVLDYPRLELKRFYPGALIRFGGRFHRLADPWRRPWDAVKGAFAPLGRFSDKLRVARLRWQVLQADSRQIFESPDSSSIDFLTQCGFSAAIIERFFRPFFAGVFLDADLETSSRMLKFVFQMFAAGETAIPAMGMGAIPEQLLQGTHEERVHVASRVTRIDGSDVVLDSGRRIAARTVVVATEGSAATAVLPSWPPVRSRSVTCVYYAAELPPIPEAVLVLAADRDGPVNNMCVPSMASPAYAPAGAALISTTVLGSPPISDDQLDAQIRRQMRGWFGAQVDRWKTLRSYRIAHALPVTRPRWQAPIEGTTVGSLRAVVCGDQCENPSIQGAMVSGRKAAEQLLAML